MNFIITKAKVLIFLIACLSCSVNEGEGGRSSIQGEIVVNYYNKSFTKLIATEPAKDEDVFIHYGDHISVDDKVSTSADGCFSFQYLHQGDYTICYYSEDSTQSRYTDIEILKEVTLGKDEDLYLDEGVILKTLDYNDGFATITGSVEMIVYDNDSEWPYLIPEETISAQDYEVYLVYEQDAGYTERVRTDDDGKFCFEFLIPGTYKVYVYSENLKGSHEMDAFEQEIVVREMNEVVAVEKFVVHNL